VCVCLAPDGSFTLRPGNRYDFMFGFELPAPGSVYPLIIIVIVIIIIIRSTRSPW